MSSPRPGDASGSPSADALTERFYAELRTIAQRAFANERSGHTLQPTAAVNEVCLRLLTSSPLPAAERAEQLALAARVLRQVLIDHHRASSAVKRGGGAARLELGPDLAAAQGDGAVDVAAVHAALDKLRILDARQAEVVTLRVFGGLTMEQVASELEVSKRTAEDDWAVARAWLRRELGEAGA